MKSEETKVAVMQEQINNLDKTVSLIITNHLPHLQRGIDDLKEDVYAIKISIAKYIGIAVGVMAVLEIIIKIIWK